MSQAYTPFYCEENVYLLLRDGDLNEASAVFVTNPSRSVAIWSQRASDRPDGLVLWDYHVIAMHGSRVIDVDCTAGDTLNLADWITASFPFAGAVPEDVEPMFRVVGADDFLTSFRTDRSHMLDENGDWRAPPPPWPALSDESNLEQFLDSSNPSVPGAVTDLRGLSLQGGVRER